MGMSYTIIPQLAVTQRLVFLDVVPLYRLPYWMALAAFSTLTCCATLNTLTNAQIFGRTMATRVCLPSTHIDTEWQHVMSRSLFGWLLPHSFENAATIAYSLALMGPLFSLMYAVPRKKWMFWDYRLEDDTYPLQYKTWWNKKEAVQHGNVLMVLSSLARFEGATFQDMTYAVARMDEIMAERGTRFYSYHRRYLSLLRAELDRGIARFAIVGLLQDAVQTNFQTTLVGVNWYVTKTDYPDLQMFFSVFMCFLSTVSDLPEALEVVKLVLNYRKNITQDVLEELDDDEKRLLTALRWRLFRFVIYCVIFLFFSLWSFLKLVALFACKNHLWNVTPRILLSGFTAGCA